MKHSTANYERCMAMVAALNTELGWHLEADQQHSYVFGLLPHLPVSPADPELRRMVITYHYDHAVVEILRDQANPRYEAAWSQWSVKVIQIIQHQGFSTPGDAMADLPDLAQTALEELIRALPTFRYSSRFTTWAYAVISRRALRYLRDRNAAKRNGKAESLELRHELDPTLDPVLGAAESPEAQSEAQILSSLIYALLDKHGDPRMGKMFHMWAIEDQRLTEIAQHMGLSLPRVSGLIDQICHLLRQEPAILAWINDTAPPGLERTTSDALSLEPPEKKSDVASYQHQGVTRRVRLATK
jgi:RNA polymerase sigma factor (sigma-70 family)